MSASNRQSTIESTIDNRIESTIDNRIDNRQSNRQSTTESTINNRIDNRQPNRQSTTESTIDNRIENGLSTGVVRVKDATITVNNRVTRVRSLRIAGGTRRNNKGDSTRRYLPRTQARSWFLLISGCSIAY